MASIKTSALVADIKGKVGGNCFARNRGGIYVRAKIKPLNPRSVLQQQRRATASAAAAAWGAITAQQRADWQAYALNTGWSNRLGDSINIGGEAAFVRQAAYLGLYAEPPYAPAPLAYGHATATVSTITASEAIQTPILAEPSTGFTGDEGATRLYLFAAMPQAGSRAMAPIRFQLLQTLCGSVGSPIAFPLTLDTWPWTYAEGQRITLAMVYKDPEFRFSIRTFASVLAAA